MVNTNVVNIHGKQYVTVAGRLQLAHEASKNISITTEVLPIADQVVVKATVVTDKGTFTGISAANQSKTIEKMSPYEVAETSAVGRALGFAGFGSMDSVATADEIVKSDESNHTNGDRRVETSIRTIKADAAADCTCGTTGKYHAKDCPARRQVGAALFN